MNLKHQAQVDVTISPLRIILRQFVRVTWLLCLVIALVSVTLWGSLAILYGDSGMSSLQMMLSLVFAVAGLTAIVGVFLRRWRLRTLGSFSLMFVVVLLWWFNISPSNDRVWQPDLARLSYATSEGDLITVHNIRNFSYRSETDFTPAYYSKTYDLSKLDSVDLFAVYWMGPAIAHTIVSFGFSGQDYLAVSIEARKERGEGYSTIKGFLRQYELIYIVADERDVIRLRTNFRKDPPEEVYRYRLQGPPENGRRFFLDYMQSVNEVKQHPRFYNTLMANCTNMIWVHSQTNPGRIPFSWKILASGYAPEHLYEMGRLDTSVSFDELKKRGHVNPVAQALDDTADFSKRIRDR